MKISIVGTGYVGLITAISLAQWGHTVICIDQFKDKVSTINSGNSPFYEKGLDQSLKDVLKKGKLKATENLAKAVLESDVIIVAVGTPTVNNKIDLSAIRKASVQIGKAIKKSKRYQIIAIKSTVLPGVTENIVKPILEKYSGKKIGQFGLVMNPEFLREGSALEDALNPDRIVIGQIDDKSGRFFAKIYAKVRAPKIFTNLPTAEMIKYSANSLLATLISFSNEISRISENTDKVDILDVWQGVHLDRRLSPFDGNKRIRPGILNYILSGCGFGGSCFPKDIKALLSFATQQGVKPHLLEDVININSTQPLRTILLLKKALGDNLKGKQIAILGLAFKPDTDDLRESPSFPIIEALLSEEAKIITHDPMAYQKGIPEQLANLPIKLADNTEDAVRGADAVIVVTAWKEYIDLPTQFFKKYMRNPIVIDARRIYDKNSFLEAGIIYKGIGL